ncbi:TetR/AcrR family transcriptional regulator [Leucobacter denitrificans]|uniref:TetR/AcrR family transcriptional regulator n=1 Tax=Leucobacter denitrificans TaxID=683042 RepID=A0A7G9S4A0_9MICO|nr:TetR/AcrR family transcriptional regulator [Leucobacter denitrificans]QNN62675.1 TetR/AcrR family transcriptional regulator [Leucobacter denitrificans]
MQLGMLDLGNTVKQTDGGLMALEQVVDPRARRSRRCMLDATAKILATEGLIGLTHQNIARHADVSRATVYRHWRTREDLVVALLEDFRMPHFTAGGGSVRERLRDSLEVQWRTLQDPHYRAVYLAAQSVADLPAVKTRLREINVERVASVCRLVEPEYRLESDESVTDVLALAVGPLLQYATFVGDESEQLRESVLDSVIQYLDRHCQAQA